MRDDQVNVDADEVAFASPTRLTALRDLVAQDMKDRGEWFDRCKKNEKERYKRENTAKPLYDGAPNLVDPVIDDLIRELKQAVVTTLWQSPRLAQFIGLDELAVRHAEAAEVAFDFHLRRIGKTRQRMSLSVDHQLTYGSAVAKLVTATGAGGREVPEFGCVSPLSVVVPTATNEITDAQRVTHLFRFTLAEFKRAAKLNGWEADAVSAIERVWKEKGAVVYSGDAAAARGHYRDGQLATSARFVEVWEVYHETSDAGRRVAVFCPALPQTPLYDRPWAWPRILASEETPPERPWPFVQFRYEDCEGFYNSRGLPEILEVDQKEASTYRTARGVSIDFAGKPFVDGVRRSTPFKFRAGEYLDGAQIVWAEPPDAAQTYQQEYARTLAMKRVGSAQGAISSVAQGDARKTATEVRTLTAAANGMSIDAVDRFAEPWGELFAMMWEQIARAAQLDGGRCGLVRGEAIPKAAFAANYAVAAGVSGRIVSQTNTLTALTNMGQLGSLMENMTATLGASAVRGFYGWMLSVLDADMARRVMDAAGAGAGAGLGKADAKAGAAPGSGQGEGGGDGEA